MTKHARIAFRFDPADSDKVEDIKAALAAITNRKRQPDAFVVAELRRRIGELAAWVRTLEDANASLEAALGQQAADLRAAREMYERDGVTYREVLAERDNLRAQRAAIAELPTLWRELAESVTPARAAGYRTCAGELARLLDGDGDGPEFDL